MLEELRAGLPDHARDLKLNLSSVLQQPELSEQQLWGTALASASAARNAPLLQAVAAEARSRLSPEAFRAARTAAALMGMNNVYYRFVHMAGGDYADRPARLRMNALARPEVDHADFELWSLAVSAINGCEMCVRSHEKVLREKGVGPDQIQAAVRIAAVIHAVAGVLDAEAALA
ncbi:carboxymuconolactone decarboxylase family protein [Benzoatithermus flavus]